MPRPGEAPPKVVADPDPIVPANQAEREKMYDRFQHDDAPPADPEKKEEQPPAKVEEDPKPTPKDFQPADPSPAAEDPDDPDKGPSAGDEDPDKAAAPADKGDKDEKVVPLAALHEERKKRQELQSQNAELQEQVKVLLDDMKTLMQKKDKEPAKPEVVEDYDQEIIKLRKQVADLEAERQQRAQEAQKTAAERQRTELQTRLETTNRELEAEGFPGFFRFRALVSDELGKVIDPAKPETLKQWDNPEGWKKLYREKVFPEISGLFAKKQLQDKNKEKEALKQKANLGKGPGAAPSGGQSEDEKEYTFADYMADRRKNGMSSS